MTLRNGRPLAAIALETTPDLAALHRSFDPRHRLADDEVLQLSLRELRQQAGHDDMPLSWLRISGFGAVLIEETGAPRTISRRVASGDEEIAALTEVADLVARVPCMLAWQAGTRVLPLLRLRAMVHGMAARPELATLQSWHDPAAEIGLPAVDDLDTLCRVLGLPPTGDSVATARSTLLLWLRHMLLAGNLDLRAHGELAGALAGEPA